MVIVQAAPSSSRWLIGSSELLTVRRLPPGITRITLRATDSRGRASRTTLRVRLLAAKPMLTLVSAPAKVSAHARRITIALKPGRTTLQRQGLARDLGVAEVGRHCSIDAAPKPDVLDGRWRPLTVRKAPAPN